MRRRQLLGCGLAAGCASLIPRFARAEGTQPISIGTTPVFLDDDVAFLRDWQAYLQRELGRPVTFVQRRSYREVSELLLAEKLDAAWICGYPYVRYRERMRLLAVPTYEGEPLYRSYVIVPSSDQTTQSIGDLGGKIYAFSDPDSNSGWLVPNSLLFRLGKDAATFFRKSFFTWGHRRVVDAVAVGLAQGGSVDGYVWETLKLHHPEVTGQTRVAQRSVKYGFPPFVTRSQLPAGDFKQLQEVLVAMRANPSGQGLLRKLNLDGFQVAPESVFSGIAENMKMLHLG
ncbi:MAG TPA: PhnD/SsuA/transferrin family substrate-binding protein [Candidatus Krumholzibacteria bacterium]|nr:PhnD/SsuA/transferrin family substrate-binding protein [Candidatus Krumholzibacteria bacterium]